MYEIEINDTIEASDPNLPTYVDSEDALAIASFPEFSFAIHPEYLYGDYCIDRSNGDLCAKVGSKPTIVSGFPNGALGFDLAAMYAAAGTGGVKAVSARAVNMTEFSFAIAIYMEYSGIAPTQMGLLTKSSDAGLDPRFSLFEGRVFGLQDSNGLYFKDPVAIPSGVPTRYIVTYSDGNGGNLYRDGVLVASNPANLVRTVDSFNVACLGTNSFLNTGTQCVVSPFYVTGIDLSKAKYVTERASITNYLMRKYSNA